MKTKTLFILSAILLALSVNSCKKDKIDLNKLQSKTWQLYDVVLRDINTGEEYNISSEYLYDKCDTILIQFTNDNLYLEYDLCSSPDTFYYNYDKKENLTDITYKDGTEYILYRIDELTNTKLKLVFVIYNKDDELTEAGMAWYLKPM